MILTICLNLADLDDTLYPLSSGLATSCRTNIEGKFLWLLMPQISLLCSQFCSSDMYIWMISLVVDYMVEKLGIDKSKIDDLCNLLYKNYGTTMAGLRV